MADAGDGLVVQVRPVDGDEDGDLLDQAALLRRELLDLDVEDVRTLTPGESPVGARRVVDLAGWPAVQRASSRRCGPSSSCSAAGPGGAAGTSRSPWAGNTLKLNGITAAEQEHIIDAWPARHATSS